MKSSLKRSACFIFLTYFLEVSITDKAILTSMPHATLRSARACLKKMKDYEAVKFNGHAKLIIELNETLRINQMRKENNSLIIEQRQKLEESEDLTHRVWAETNKMGFNIPSWVAYFPGFDELPSTKKTRGT